MSIENKIDELIAAINANTEAVNRKVAQGEVIQKKLDDEAKKTSADKPAPADGGFTEAPKSTKKSTKKAEPEAPKSKYTHDEASELALKFLGDQNDKATWSENRKKVRAVVAQYLDAGVDPKISNLPIEHVDAVYEQLLELIDSVDEAAEDEDDGV